jgi:dynactin complex subunit
MATSTHSITITGKVQDIGFRNTIEHIGRKLDKANVLLKTGFEKLNTDLNTGFSTLTTIMSENNKEQRGHNTRLEAILEKLAEK